ncbi:MAG TPA: zf-HC2 domain-containing protein [Polyangia bacterium]|jgi:hypothetical protein|nr:zf-HC2 domain-containing protein [Polyangia bacterium]
MSLLLHRWAIARAVAGELPEAKERTLRTHLAGCAACRAHYDRLSLAAEAIAPAATHRRERLRLQAALNPATQAPVPALESFDWLRWLRWTPLLLAPAAALFLLVRPARPPSPRDTFDGKSQIAWRGRADAVASEVGLLVYAGRRSDGGVTPVRLVADFPGSGEGSLHLDDYVQFSVRGLRQASYVTVAGLDERGEVHVYAPRPDAPARPVEPGAKPVTLGPSINLSVKHHAGRLRLFAVATSAPLGSADITAAIRRAGFSGTLALPGSQAAGLLAITP